MNLVVDGTNTLWMNEPRQASRVCVGCTSAGTFDTRCPTNQKPRACSPHASNCVCECAPARAFVCSVCVRVTVVVVVVVAVRQSVWGFEGGMLLPTCGGFASWIPHFALASGFSQLDVYLAKPSLSLTGVHFLPNFGIFFFLKSALKICVWDDISGL